MSEQFSILIDSRTRFETSEPGGVWLSMPTTKEQLHEAMQRVGITADNPQDFLINGFMNTEQQPFDVPLPVIQSAGLDELNYLGNLLSMQRDEDRNKFTAAVTLGERAGNIKDLINLAQNLDCCHLRRRGSMSSIKRLSPPQSRKVNSLVRRECCNCDNGHCILLDDGDECVCPQLISYSLLCKWFRIAVLPLDKLLYAELFKTEDKKRCTVCGAFFASRSNSVKYCPDCRKRITNRQAAERMRKRRALVTR